MTSFYCSSNMIKYQLWSPTHKMISFYKSLKFFFPDTKTRTYRITSFYCSSNMIEYQLYSTTHKMISFYTISKFFFTDTVSQHRHFNINKININIAFSNFHFQSSHNYLINIQSNNEY